MRTFALSTLAVVLLLAAAAPAPADSSARDRALVLRLKKQRLTRIEFKQAGLGDVLKWMRIATGQNILIKHAALAKAGVEWQEITYTVELQHVSAWTFLEEIVAKPHDMALKVQGNIVFLTSKADSYGKPVTRMYAISHITWTKHDFIGPDINLHPSGFTPEDDYEPERVVEDDPLNNGDAVAELLKEIVVPKLWDENDTWRISATDRYLVIRAPVAVHRLVPGALAKIASMK